MKKSNKWLATLAGVVIIASGAANAAEIADADLQAAGLWSEFDNLAGDPSRASSSITNGSYTAAKAFDGNYDNVEPNRFMVNSLPVSLYYRFDSPKCVNAIRISNQCWVGGQSRSPKAFVFEGSNDGETWTTIGSESGLSTWANTSDSKYGTNGTMTRRIFKYANAASYIYYRITFTETMSGAAVLAVSEIDFYHMEPYYWRGPAAEDANLSNPNNWSLADGQTATAEPGADCSIVFTNDATVTVDKPLSVQSISANGYAVLFDNPAPDDSGAVATNTLTVSGSITGGTDKFAVFRCKVQCTDRFKKASRSQFPGGLTARYMHEHCNAWGTNTKMLEGEFFFTEPWPLAGSASVPWTLGTADLPDSVLHAPTLTSTDASMLTVLQRSKAYFSGDMQMGRPDENHPSGAATLPILRIERGYARIAGTLSSISGYMGSGPSVHGTNHVRRLVFTTNGSADDKYRIDTVCYYPKFVIDEGVENSKRRYSVVFVNMHNRLDFYANGDFTFDRKGGNKAVVSSRSSGANFILGWHTTWEGASHNITVNQDFGPSNHEGYLPTFGMEIDGEGGSVTLNEPIALNSGTVISGKVKAVAGAAGVFGTSAVSAGAGTTLCISNGVALTNAVNIASGATLEYLDGASISGAVTLADGSAIALRFTTAAAAPCISFASAPTVNGKVTVNVSADVALPFETSYMLTSGAHFADISNFTLDSSSAGWADLSLDANGDLVLSRKSHFYIRIADGASSNLAVPFQWIYDKTAVGSMSEIETALTSDGANGIPAWQSYCLGLTPDDASSVILCEAAADQSDPGRVAIKAANINIPEGLEGVEVSATLERKIPGGKFTAVTNATFVSGAVAFITPEICDGISFFV